MAAGKQISLRLFELAAAVCLVSFAFVQSLAAQQSQGSPYVISRIEFQGNRRVQTATLLARMFSRQGDAYNEEALRRDFQALWNTQFFEDLRLEVEDDPKQAFAKLVIFYVTERPIIRRIEYKGNKSISESDILDAFKDKKVGLSVESSFDPTKIKRAEVVIKGLLAEHGRQFATVKPTYERIAATNAVKLVFNIDEGPKVKVGTITFVGNKAFSDRRLIRAMRHDRPYAIPLYLGDIYIPVGSKTFDRRHLDEDLEVGIRGLYQDHGHFKVVVDASSIKTVDENHGGIPGPWPIVGSKHGKATEITIKIDEGEVYRMGKLNFRNADPEQGLVFKSEVLQRVFPLKEGDIFSAEKIRKALDTFKKLYGELGYIDFVATPLTEIDDKKRVVNLTMELDQQKQFFIRRIEFAGNTTTRDKVIRRELLIDEGQVFNNRLWELSLLRLNQLNFFDAIKPENAELKRDSKAGTVDIKLKVHEKGKQSISFNGGVSGISGSFIGLTYQTNNFLGLGETLTLGGQLGQRQTNLTFGFTEPYLFDRPIATGFTAFITKFNYNQERELGILAGQQIALNPALEENYTTNSKGFTFFASYPLRRFSFTRIGLTYGYSQTDITTLSQAATNLFEAIQFRGLAGPSALKGIRESKITPTITYNTVNNPINPTSGKSFFLGTTFEGGPLQGNVNSISTSFTTTYFHPVNKRKNVFGFRFLCATETGYGGKDVVPYNRFYQGGDSDIRGFDFFTIAPFVDVPTATSTAIFYKNPTILGPTGQPITQSITVPLLEFFPTRPGGDTQLVTNVEYRIPIAGPVSTSLFTDLGMDGVLHGSQLDLNTQAFSLIQQEFPGDLSARKLAVISGTNFHPHSSSGIELVVQLPIVNAPFRFYYAYNFLRLTETIQGRTGDFDRNTPAFQTLPPGILQAQIVPQLNTILQNQAQSLPAALLEPKHTFRFSVSRTF